LPTGAAFAGWLARARDLVGGAVRVSLILFP
jgi:hypothetical protein